MGDGGRRISCGGIIARRGVVVTDSIPLTGWMRIVLRIKGISASGHGRD